MQSDSKGGSGKGSNRGKGDSGRGGVPHRVRSGGGKGGGGGGKDDARRAARVKQMESDDNWRARPTGEAHANSHALNKHATPFPSASTASPSVGQQPPQQQQQQQSQQARTQQFTEEAVDPPVRANPYGAAGPHSQQPKQPVQPTMPMQQQTMVMVPVSMVTGPGGVPTMAMQMNAMGQPMTAVSMNPMTQATMNTMTQPPMKNPMMQAPMNAMMQASMNNSMTQAPMDTTAQSSKNNPMPQAPMNTFVQPSMNNPMTQAPMNMNNAMAQGQMNAMTQQTMNNPMTQSPMNTMMPPLMNNPMSQDPMNAMTPQAMNNPMSQVAMNMNSPMPQGQMNAMMPQAMNNPMSQAPMNAMTQPSMSNSMPPTPMTSTTQPITPNRSSLPVKAPAKAGNRLMNAKLVKVQQTVPTSPPAVPESPTSPTEGIIVRGEAIDTNDDCEKTEKSAVPVAPSPVIPQPAISTAVVSVETPKDNTCEEDESELKRLLGRGTSMSKVEAMDEWMNYLTSHQHNEADGEAALGRGNAARGRGRCRLMNQRLDRGRGRGSSLSGGVGAEGNVNESSSAAFDNGGDDGEISTPQSAEPDPQNVANEAATSPTSSIGKATTSEPTPSTTVPSSSVATAAATGRGSSRATGRRGGRGSGKGTGPGTPNVEDSIWSSATESPKTAESTTPSTVPLGPAPVLSPGPKAWGPPPSSTVSTSTPKDAAMQNPKQAPAAHQNSTPKLSPRSITSTASPSSVALAEAPVNIPDESQTTATQEKEEEETSHPPIAAASSTALASTQERRQQQASADDESPPGSPSGAQTTGSFGLQASPTPATSSNSPAPTTEENPPSALHPSAPSSAGVRLDEVPRENGTAPPVAKESFGGWERAFKRDDELLRSCSLWCKKVEADGACLFRAFSDQLEGDGGSNHLKYRGICVSYLEANRAEYAPFVEGNFKGYCTRLREPAEWAGEIEAQALCRALGINALIHRPDVASSAEEVPSAAVEVINFAEDAQCVQLCFHPRYHAGPHYNSVRSAGDKGESMPSKFTLTQVRDRMSEALRLRR